MSLWQRFLTWLGTGAIVALEGELHAAMIDAEGAWDSYFALREQVALLQTEIEVVTDGHVQFVPKFTVTENELVREHNRKQFFRLVEE